MPSPSPKSPSSTPTTQRSQAASTTPSSARQNSDKMNAAAAQTESNTMPDLTDPSQRSTGKRAEIMNKDSKPSRRRSEHKLEMEKHHADLLKYHEDRRAGKIEGESVEEWEDFVSKERAQHLEKIETSTVKHAFFAVDYSHGFTGRGMLPEASERPCLVGPRNEIVEETFGPFGESRAEQVDRPLWRASDANKVSPSGESRDEEEVESCLFGEWRNDREVGPFGEWRDEERVGPFGEWRDEDQDGRDQGHQEEEEEEEVAGPGEDMNELMQLAANSVALMLGVLTKTGDASSPHIATTLPIEPQAPLASSSLPLTSTPLTPSRKRARDSEDVTDEESSSQQKRMRMDDILGIVRKDANSGKSRQNVGAVMTSDIQQSRKRARSLDEDSEDGMTEPTAKRLRLYERIEEVHDGDEKYITAGQADVNRNDDSTLDYQDTSSSAAREATRIEKAHTQPSVEEEPSTNDENEERDDASTGDENALTDTEWDTAHGINSQCSNIYITGKGVYDVTGVWRALYLPRCNLPSDRPWTDEEQEDLRVYIQDYGIEDWALLSQSTDRLVEELHYMYFEVITARNVQAGRLECVGIPEAYPDLAPPPAPAPEEPRKLRSQDQKGKTKKNGFGDLIYDVKAISFPKVTRDGGMVDAKGNVIYRIMGDISHVTKRRQPKVKEEDPVRS